MSKASSVALAGMTIVLPSMGEFRWQLPKLYYLGFFTYKKLLRISNVLEVP